MAIKILGSAGTNTPEVETNTDAMRMVLRPDDYASLGIFSLGATSGIMAAGLGASAPIFSFRYSGANTILLKRLVISAGNTATAFASGIIEIAAFFARSFTASDTGGNSVLPSGNGNKLRTSMTATGVTDIRISSTGTLSAGTRTLDAVSFAHLSSGIPATAGSVVILPAVLFETKLSDYPMCFVNNEGFVIQVTQIPATGTWTFSVNVVWEEVTTFGPAIAA